MSLTKNQDSSQHEVTLAGFLVAILEQRKWFIVVPLLVGILALAAVSLRSPEYRSSAVVRGDELVALISSPAVLYRTAEEFKMNTGGRSLGQAAENLAGRLSRKLLAPNVHQINLTWPDPNQAEPILASLLANLSRQLKPVGQEKAFVEAQAALAKQHFDELQAYAKLYSANEVLSPMERFFFRAGDTAAAYVALVDQIKQTQLEIRSAERQLSGLSEDDIMQPPTLPEELPVPNRAIYAFLFASASALIVGAIVLISEWLRVSAAGKYANEFLRMREVLGLRN